MTETRLVPGRDYAEEMAKVVEQIRHLSGEVELGQALGHDVTQQQATLDAAKAELRRLGSLKPVPARIEPVGAGRTFRQRWEELDVQGRNAFLRESEIEVWVEPWADNLPHLLALPKPASDQAVILFGEGMRIVIDLGKLEKLRHQARNA